MMVQYFLHALIALLISMSFFGCGNSAPDRPENVGSSESQKVASIPDVRQNEISYRILNQDTTYNAAVSMSLVQTESVMKSKDPLVLPAVVPDAVSIEVKLYDEMASDLKIYSVRGTLSKGGTVVRTFPEAAFSSKVNDNDGGFQMQFVLKDLRALFSETEHDSVSVSLVIFDRLQNVEAKRVQFDLQTPPSAIDVKVYTPASLYEDERKISIPNEYRSVSTSEIGALELIGIVELKGQDDQGIELAVPFEFIHRLDLVTTNTTVNSSECGHSVSSAVVTTKLDSTMRLMPLGGDINSAVVNTAKTGASYVSLAPSATVQIGLYSTKRGTFDIPRSKLTEQTVPTRCMAQCTSGGEGDWADEGKWGGSCTACGRSPSNMGESCFSCMRTHPAWCRWQHWRSWTDYTNVSVGSSYQLELIPEDQKVSSEFLLAYKSQQASPRKIRIISQKIVLK